MINLNDIPVTPTTTENDSKIIDQVMKIDGIQVIPNQTFSIMNQIIDKNLDFVDKSNVVLISGCNLVVYNLENKSTTFLIRKCPEFKITSLSVGHKNINSPYICIGEFNPMTSVSQISTISVKNPEIQNILSHFQKDDASCQDWRISSAQILYHSSYCLSISKKVNHGIINSKISFWKYTHKKFISEVIFPDDLNSCSSNPQNPLELIFCGKGYLRLWNVLINQGSLKEHPHRLLRGKQEKDFNFLKVEFFKNKSFMFIAGTKENLFYVIEGFEILFEFYAGYELESLNNLFLDKKFNNQEEFNYSNLYDDESSTEIADKKINNGNVPTTNVNISVSRNNPLTSFYLIEDKHVLIGFENSSITYIYTLTEKLKNKKPQDSIENEKNSVEDSYKVMRLSSNSKSIIRIICNSDYSLVLYMVEISNSDHNKQKSELNSTISPKDTCSNTINPPQFCLYLFTRSGSHLTNPREVFIEYFVSSPIKSFDYNERKKIIYILTNDNWLRCFDYNTNAFSIKHQFTDGTSILTVSPNTNLFAVCYTDKMIVYAIFKHSIRQFCEFEIINPYAQFSHKGDYIAVAGESRVNKNYCIYFIDTNYFNTVYVIENLPKIKKLNFVDNDKWIFALLDNSYILGWTLHLDLMTLSLMNRINQFNKNVENYYFRLNFKHSIRGFEYDDYDFDSKNELLLVSHKTSNRLQVYKNKNILIGTMETPYKSKIIKIVKDMKCLIVGYEEGSMVIYNWPLREESDNKNTFNHNRNKFTQINLHTLDLNGLYISKNRKSILSSSVDGSLILSNLLIKTGNIYKEFDHFLMEGKKNKPLIEEFIKLSDVYEYKISQIKKIDQRALFLDNNINSLKHSMKEQKDLMINDYNLELSNIDMQKDEAYAEEERKEIQLRSELEGLKLNIDKELQTRINDHENEKQRLTLKFTEKLQLYRNEIDKLNLELKNLEDSIENKFKFILINQTENFRKVYDYYDRMFFNVKNKINERISYLVKNSAQYDEAVETIIKSYKDMVHEMNIKISHTVEKNQNNMKDLKKTLENEHNKENEYKNNLYQRVVESDKIILKNADIKKNIIDTTQRTITFQEQLLETDKNLTKIANKLKDLDVKNKHLEQIRFVLEHRMVSLDKEKSPLEGQCAHLENKKNSLQQEFNKLILQINLKNQELERNQSELRACLIQNFEINDQTNFLKKKLIYLQNEIKNFIIKEGEKKSIKENKATTVALELREFYTKYFGNNIDDELLNYQYYMNKLQEENEKMNLVNNQDLIIKNKGEEKLIAEFEKLKLIEFQKEEGFRRMQNENTILISECNRLRKNLHEVYMNVVNIESKFEELTKIHPGLNKTEIVYQIKDFIKQTHNKIRRNFNNNSITENDKIKNESKFIDNIQITQNNQNDLVPNINIKSIEDFNENVVQQYNNLDGINSKINYLLHNSSNSNESHNSQNSIDEGYDGFLRLPNIKNSHSHSQLNSLSNPDETNVKNHNNTNISLLPSIDH